MKVSSLLTLSKWQIFLTRIYINFLMVKIWKRNNISIASHVNFIGVPIISNNPNAKIIIGKNSVLCSSSHETALGVSHRIILRTLSPNAKLIIGKNVRMSGTTICAANSIFIGDRCVIGSDVWLVDTDFHSLNSKTRSSVDDSKDANTAPVNIGNDVFIGGRSIILKGVTLGNNVIVGAGSVVTRSFPNNSIIAGNPAVLIKSIP